MQAQAAGGGEGLSGLLQNPKVQIGVIGAGAVALIVVIYVLFFNKGGEAPPPPVPTGPSATAPASPGASPAAAGGPGSPMPSSPGGNTAMAPAPASPGVPKPPAGAAAGKEAAPRVASPGVPTRKNPFAPNKEITDVLKSVPPVVEAAQPTPPPQDLYSELNPPKPKKSVDTGDEGEGPPVPPMRVAGFVQGAQLSAIMQIGSGTGGRFLQALPGGKITYGPYTYKVERLEQDKVVLVNNWEIGDRKGVQRIEVTLSGSAGRSAGTPGAEMGAQ